MTVDASASPLFGDFLVVVSVTNIEGKPRKSLKARHFTVHQLASRNRWSAQSRPVAKATESPPGVYTLELQENEAQPKLPRGRYVLSVRVSARRRASNSTDDGQAVFTAEMS